MIVDLWAGLQGPIYESFDVHAKNEDQWRLNENNGELAQLGLRASLGGNVH